MRVKLSGISDLYSAKIAEEYNTDFISFNFDTADKDYLTLEHAHVIAQQIPETRKVGEFRNMPLNYVNKAADSVGVDYVQLNGSESDRYIKRVEQPRPTKRQWLAELCFKYDKRCCDIKCFRILSPAPFFILILEKLISAPSQIDKNRPAADS